MEAKRAGKERREREEAAPAVQDRQAGRLPLESGGLVGPLSCKQAVETLYQTQ